jgi:serine/threonine protein kinase
MITKNKQIKLTDFGAARVFDTEDTKSITVVLKRGYAPEEQYRAKGNQGPWTDVYALCATMYRMITGVTPQEALERIIEDNVEPLSKYDSTIWPETEYAIMKGLSLRAQDRFQSVNELIDALYYSVLEYDEDGTPRLVVTKDNVQEAPVQSQPVQHEEEEEFDSKPIVVSIGRSTAEEFAASVLNETSTQQNSQAELRTETESQPVQQEAPKQQPVQEAPKQQEVPKQQSIQQEVPEPRPVQQEAQKSQPVQETPQQKPVQEASVQQTAQKQPEKKGFFKSTFKKLVKLQLGKVRFEDNVIDLNVEHMDVGNIQVLKECYELKKLVLNNNMVDDLSPLANCSKLEYLALRNTLVGDLSPISNCKNLKYLDLWGSRVTDLNDLYSLTKLTYLCVKNTEIKQVQIDEFKRRVPDCVVEF